MPLRTRIKRAFTRSSTSSDSNSLSKSSSRKDSNVYQPGEKMPPMKYRRPVNPEHKERLEAFSFAKAWRRKSDQSVYSPMGSRMPSRKNSTQTQGRKSFQAPRSGSLATAPHRAASSGAADGVSQVKEGSDEEDDVANVGLSRQHTHDSKANRATSLGNRSHSLRSGGSRPHTGRGGSGSTKTDQPFTAEELELALKRSHLDAPKEESDGTPPNTSAA